MTSVKVNLNLRRDASENAVILEDDTDRQLRAAQITAHDAMTTAASALAQSHITWAQIRTKDHSERGIAREAQIASVAATVAAAASVAKAAVEAAKAIANVSIKAYWQGGGQVGRSTCPRSAKCSDSPERCRFSLGLVVYGKLCYSDCCMPPAASSE